MIRLAELRLPLAQAEAPLAALSALAAAKLQLPESALSQVTVFKRSFDARKAELLAVYIVDVALANAAQESECLQRLANDPHAQPTPDMAWHPPVAAPVGWSGERPVVVGFGPCGIFAALV